VTHDRNRTLHHAHFDAAAAAMTPALRLARLRPQYAHLYPGVAAGVWEVAANVAERLQRRHAWSGERTANGSRPMSDAHFEFRGGTRMGPPRADRRSRWTDASPDN
jgi:hypothetical protein